MTAELITTPRKSSVRERLRNLFSPKSKNVDTSNKGPFNRRQFLKFGAVIAGAIALENFNTKVGAAPDVPPPPPPTDVQPKPPNPAKEIVDAVEKVNPFKSELISGVEVYGTSEAYNVEKIKAFHEYIDQSFINGYTKDHPETTVIKNIAEVRDKLLDPDKRYLQIYVDKELYDSLLKADENDPNHQTNFVAWMNAQMDYFNQSVQKTDPQSKIRGEIRRIVVVDKDTASSLEGIAPKFTGTPIDVDGVWPTLYKNTRNADQKTPDPIVWKTTTKDGKTIEVLIDDNMNHEWWHRLFGIIDEYSEDFSNPKKETYKLPSLKLKGDVGLIRTPFAQAWLRFVQAKRLRGGFLKDGDSYRPEGPYYGDNSQNKFPKNDVAINFKISGSQISQDSITNVWGNRNRGTSDWGPTYAEKWMEEFEKETRDGKIILGRKTLESYTQEADGQTHEGVPTTNLVFRVVENGKETFIHLPLLFLNTLALMDANTIEVTLDIVNPTTGGFSPPHETEQTINFLRESELEEFKKQNNKNIFAVMTIPTSDDPNTNLYYVWTISEKNVINGSIEPLPAGQAPPHTPHEWKETDVIIVPQRGD